MTTLLESLMTSITKTNEELVTISSSLQSIAKSLDKIDSTLSIQMLEMDPNCPGPRITILKSQA